MACAAGGMCASSDVACGGGAGAGGGGAAHGGACCEKVGEAEVQWTYMGEKKGSYEQVDEFQFIGEGKGDFVMENVTTYYGCRVRPCCLALLLLVLIAVIVVIIIFVKIPVAVVTSTTPAAIIFTTTRRPDTSMITTTSLPYDCDEDYHDCYQCLRIRWSYAKRHWCCRHVGRGCHTTTTEVSFDCNAGYNNWVAGWSEEKQEWCCKVAGRACPTTTPCPHNKPGQFPPNSEFTQYAR